MSTATTQEATYKITRKRLSSLKPAPENLELYRAIVSHDPDNVSLRKSIAENGLHEPLIVSLEGVVVSGNRRLAALTFNGAVTCPCRVLQVRWSDLSRDERIALLRDHNRQRGKTSDEQANEALVDINPDLAYAILREGQRKSVFASQYNGVATLKIEGRKVRRPISPENAEHVRLIKHIVFDLRRKYWPLSCRAIHYPLLNFKFLRNTADKIEYVNDLKSYKTTCDLITRLRLNGDIPWEAITDQTRPVKEFNAFKNITQFIKQRIAEVFTGYWRDLQQSQPNYIELMVEKNTIYSMALSVTERYQIPTSSGRGFGSIDWLHDIYERYQASGKERLIVITLSDYDPEGLEIPQVIGRTLRDDLELDEDEFDIIRAGVTREQITKYNLPSGGKAKGSKGEKKNAGRSPAFIKANNGDDRVWELEALDPFDMLRDLEDIIKNVLDLDLYNHEVEQEKSDAVTLRAKQIKAAAILKGQLLS